MNHSALFRITLLFGTLLSFNAHAVQCYQLLSHQGSELIRAILKENTFEMKQLLKETSDINFQDSKGMTPLHHAIKLRNAVAIGQILRLQPDTNILDHSGLSPLDYAVMTRQRPVVRKLVSIPGTRASEGIIQKPDFFPVYEGVTALHHAIYHGELSIVKDLLKVGADVNRKTEGRSYSPLEIALRRAEKMRPENVEIISSLLKAGADVHAVHGFTFLPFREKQEQDQIHTPWLMAEIHPHREALLKLIAPYIDVALIEGVKVNDLTVVTSSLLPPMTPGQKAQTWISELLPNILPPKILQRVLPLWKKGKLNTFFRTLKEDVSSWELFSNALIQKASHSRQSQRMIALLEKRKFKEAIDLLNSSSYANTRDRRGSTLLMLAIENARAEIVDELLQTRGIQINALTTQYKVINNSKTHVFATALDIALHNLSKVDQFQPKINPVDKAKMSASEIKGYRNQRRAQHKKELEVIIGMLKEHNALKADELSNLPE